MLLNYTWFPEHIKSFFDYISIHATFHFSIITGSEHLILQLTVNSFYCSVDKLCQLFVTPWTAAYQSFLSFTISQSVFKPMSIESVMPSNHLIFCCPFLLLPSVLPSVRVFSSESTLCIKWPKYWSFSFSISPSNEYSGLISFWIDWFDLLSVQGTLRSPIIGNRYSKC